MKKDISGEGAGNALTHWGTPAWCTEGLIEYWPELLTGKALEPSAGEGAIVDVLAGHGQICDAIEIRDECRPKLESLLQPCGSGCVVIGDVLQERFDSRRYDRIIANPPYRPAWTMVRHVRRYFDLIYPNDGIVAALLPLSFLSGGNGRREFWPATPPLTQVLFFGDRPSFAETGGMFDPAWFVWALGRDARHPRMICEPKPVRKTLDW